MRLSDYYALNNCLKAKKKNFVVFCFPSCSDCIFPTHLLISASVGFNEKLFAWTEKKNYFVDLTKFRLALYLPNNFGGLTKFLFLQLNKIFC